MERKSPQNCLEMMLTPSVHLLQQPKRQRLSQPSEAVKSSGIHEDDEDKQDSYDPSDTSTFRIKEEKPNTSDGASRINNQRPSQDDDSDNSGSQDELNDVDEAAELDDMHRDIESSHVQSDVRSLDDHERRTYRADSSRSYHSEFGKLA